MADFEDAYERSDRDRPLGFHWRVPDLAQQLGLSPARNAAFEAARSSILVEAMLANEAGQAVSYSRNKTFYAALDRYHGTAYTYQTVLDSVADLADAGLIEDCRVKPGNLGWQSSFYATGRLIEAWPGIVERVEYDPGEIIRLKDENGKLIDYGDTHRTRRMRKQLAALNEALADLEITVPAAKRRGLHLVIDNGPADDGKSRRLSHILPHPGNGIWRVFSRASFACHGRAYGWWQSIPGEARQSMTINGEAVSEVDYGALHTTMLYNEAGVRLDRPPYDIDGFERGDIKLGMNIAFNAKTRPAAVAALADKLGKGRSEAAKVIGAILSHHRPIEGMFGSDAGIRLMRRDSDLILAALKAANDNGILALPVHDALIVPRRCQNHTAQLMGDAFDRVIGGLNPCKVQVKQAAV
jgi:hypothetical protein